jgi:hypothetical protein
MKIADVTSRWQQSLPESRLFVQLSRTKNQSEWLTE